MPFMPLDNTFDPDLSSKPFLVNHPFLLVNLSLAYQTSVQIIRKRQVVFSCNQLYAAFERIERFFQRLCFYSILSISKSEKTSLYS